MSVFVHPVCMNRVTSVNLFLCLTPWGLTVEKLLSQIQVFPNRLPIESTKFLKSGKQDSGRSVLNEIPISCALLHKMGMIMVWVNGYH